MKPSVFLLVAGIWCVVLALATFNDPRMYLISRWAICSAAILGVFTEKSAIRWLLLVVAILFNPIEPVPLRIGRDGWKIIDWVAAALFFISSMMKK